MERTDRTRETAARGPLREDQIQRYARHVLLPDVGGRGQKRLLAAAVAVELGPGRAAEITALAYLAAAGVGRLVLVGDVGGPVGDDEIAGGVLLGAADRGRPRGQAVRERIAALNPDVAVSESDEADGLRLADELMPADPSALALGPGGAAADALARAGAAAARLLVRIARPRS
jgi:molybdopterin/thiamine biosynthesis adenylyltransferase